MKIRLLMAAAVFSVSPVLAKEIRVSTRAGAPVVVLHEAEWTRTCSSTGGPQVTFSPQPANGLISTRPVEKVVRRCDAGGCECKGRTVSGPEIVYTPQAGFKGQDRFGFDSRFRNGVTLRHNVTVTVR